mmetsp:Transcript_59923/g.111040  ORF Transcript_59923/g.111040 Transcript_59923/m.111040 type:complete len:145 (-) Transcript_59923:141-575(-)
MAGEIDEKTLRECFDIFDKNSEGKVAAQDLPEAMRSLGHVLTEAEALAVRREVGGASVNWQQFSDILKKRPRQPIETSAALLKQFKVFDDANTGGVNAQDLQHIVSCIGDKLTPDEYQAALKAAGLPSQGRLDYRQLVEKAVGK